MKIDLRFECNYSIEFTNDLASGRRFYYPGGRTDGGKDGLMVEIVSSEKQKWTGIFGYGDVATNGLSGIFSTPDPGTFCVVSKGAGYIVSSWEPEDWVEVKAIPVVSVFPIVSQNVLVFADFTELVAYDGIGIRWRTERLSYDGFEIVEVTDRFIKGKFWNNRIDSSDTFEVDLATGRRIGGSKVF